MAADIMRAFQALSTEKEAVRRREEQLLASLRGGLGRLGYRLESINGDGASRPGPRVTARGNSKSLGRKPLDCPECGRTFALPLHLGRHMSVMHKGTKQPQVTTLAGESRSTEAIPAGATKPRRRSGMSPAARRAAAKRMRAYWRKRKATEAKAVAASKPGRRSTHRRRGGSRKKTT